MLPHGIIDYTRTVRAIWESECTEANQIRASYVRVSEDSTILPYYPSESATSPSDAKDERPWRAKRNIALLIGFVQPVHKS